MFKSKPVAVETLAANLTDAVAVREEQVRQAHANFHAARSAVIEQGRERAAELRRLEAEAAAEAAKAEALVADALKR